MPVLSVSSANLDAQLSCFVRVVRSAQSLLRCELRRQSQHLFTRLTDGLRPDFEPLRKTRKHLATGLS